MWGLGLGFRGLRETGIPKTKKLDEVHFDLAGSS